MKLFNQLLRGIFLLIVGANIFLYATGIEGRTITDDRTNASLVNTLGATNIVDLSGRDFNGNPVNNFIICSLPHIDEGILYLSNGITKVSLGQLLTLRESNGLKFDPDSGFIGDVQFTYMAVDDNGVRGNVATVTIPLVAPSIVSPVEVKKPTADDKMNPEMLNTLGAVNILDLSGTDSNGDAVDCFIITSLPAVRQGVLYLADGKSGVKLNQTLTLEEANGLKFDPNSNFVGAVKFTYVAVDTNGIKSTNATVTIPLISSYNTDIVAHDDEGYGDENSAPITIDVLANDTGTLDGATVHLIDNSENMVQELIVKEEGVWRVEDNNWVVFTPTVPFIGTPTSVSYLVQDANGAVSNSATISISGRCVCKAYREDIPVFSNLGLFFMVLFTLLVGSLLIHREVIDWLL